MRHTRFFDSTHSPLYAPLVSVCVYMDVDLFEGDCAVLLGHTAATATDHIERLHTTQHHTTYNIQHTRSSLSALFPIDGASRICLCFLGSVCGCAPQYVCQKALFAPSLGPFARLFALPL